MNNKILKVKVVKNYGKQHLYPACETSKFFCEIAGQVTVSDSLYQLLSKKGYKFIQPEIEI